jgi:hypothetical protein
MERPLEYDLFQVVFLDYLFGCRDRIANCFTMNGSLLILDTGFSFDPMPSSVNFGKPSDYLDFHVQWSDVCHLRTQYAPWYSNLVRFANTSNWFGIAKILPRSFATEESVVRTRARKLLAKLQLCV